MATWLSSADLFINLPKCLWTLCIVSFGPQYKEGESDSRAKRRGERSGQRKRRRTEPRADGEMRSRGRVGLEGEVNEWRRKKRGRLKEDAGRESLDRMTQPWVLVRPSTESSLPTAFHPSFCLILRSTEERTDVDLRPHRRRTLESRPGAPGAAFLLAISRCMRRCSCLYRSGGHWFLHWLRCVTMVQPALCPLSGTSRLCKGSLGFDVLQWWATTYPQGMIGVW